jgi:alkylation response protein AidB-like acyl-CoA dehydrogenase
MNTPPHGPIDESTLAALAEHAERADAELTWPAASWDVVRAASVLGWNIPPEYGGRGLGAVEILSGHERLAGACLTTAFILSQREAAVRRIREHGSADVYRRLLPPLARGELFTTVGLSQLTTSRQHGAPALTAALDDNQGYILDGVSPWVTGADHADVLLVGATLPDHRQLIALLPRDRAGVEVESPMDLSALRGSQTTQVRCRGVRVGAAEALAGPAERVLGGGKGAGGLETSCLALGLAGAAIDLLHGEAKTRGELRSAAERFEQARRDVRRTMHRLAETGGDPSDATALRVRATRLALQATQATLTTAKGTGFVRPHPAQRWARQALFFLVWSCPRPAAEGILAHLLPEVGE